MAIKQSISYFNSTWERERYIKKLVDDFLQNDPNVLAYHSAQPKDGGTGAVYVHLKNINKSNNSDEYYEEE